MLRWRDLNEAFNTTYVILAVYANGTIIHWHVTGSNYLPLYCLTFLGKVLHEIHEKDNTTICCSFSKDCLHYATGGRDNIVRVYDEVKKNKCLEMEQWDCCGHNNRIYCVKFIDENLLLSGGWDSYIVIWDRRLARSLGYMYGPYIGGDSIDYKNG